MLLNGAHLLPDLTGALVWPKQRLIAVSDPISDVHDRRAPQVAGEILRHLAALLRQRKPARVVWLGAALPSLLAQGRLPQREATEITRMAAAHAWTWIADGLPGDLPGTGAPEITVEALTFRHATRPGMVAGEVSAALWPTARLDGQDWPCFVTDGRRLVIPAFASSGQGSNVLAPAFQTLFRRPFHALVLAGGRIVTRTRDKLGKG